MKPRSPATISYTMSRIRGKNTGIELLLRRALTQRGLHYRHNSAFVYGHPDISFKGYKVAVFCDSEFWHGYEFAENEKKIKTHLDYWIPKIQRNIARDEEVNAELAKEGYLVLRFWGKEIERDPGACAERVVAALRSRGYLPKK
jgi:DNA mismatch endonuclease, patch repair protein